MTKSPETVTVTHARPIDVTAVHVAHADFVWTSLHRLGVREADLPDGLQDVFVVVHRRLHTYDGSSKLTTWLFGICMRVAAAYHRKAHRRREQPTASPDETVIALDDDPEERVSKHQAAAQLEIILASMDLEKRAVFVMFEIDQLPCAEIADVVGVPVGTVYSRLHAARRVFSDAVARMREGGRFR